MLYYWFSNLGATTQCVFVGQTWKKENKAFEMGTRKALKMPFFIKLGTKLPEENVTCRVALVVLQLVCNLQMKLQAVVLPLGQSVFIKGGPSINLYSVGCAIEFRSVFML